MNLCAFQVLEPDASIIECPVTVDSPAQAADKVMAQERREVGLCAYAHLSIGIATPAHYWPCGSLQTPAKVRLGSQFGPISTCSEVFKGLLCGADPGFEC